MQYGGLLPLQPQTRAAPPPIDQTCADDKQIIRVISIVINRQSWSPFRVAAAVDAVLCGVGVASHLAKSLYDMLRLPDPVRTTPHAPAGTDVPGRSGVVASDSCPLACLLAAKAADVLRANRHRDGIAWLPVIDKKSRGMRLFLHGTCCTRAG